MTDFRNRKVLITGAASGIGRLLALRIAARGGRLILWDPDAAHLAAVADEIAAAGGQIAAYARNLAERASIEAAAARTLAEHGAVDVLINDAGIVDGKRMLEATDEEVERTFAVHTLAHFRTVRAFLPGMLAQGAGHIVTIASASGIAAVPRLADYSAGKAAAVAFDESLRLELKHDGAPVRTTVVCPFYIATGMFEGVRTLPAAAADHEAGGRRRAHRARHRARRVARDPALVRAPGLPAAHAAGGLVRRTDGLLRHHEEHG